MRRLILASLLAVAACSPPHEAATIATGDRSIELCAMTRQALLSKADDYCTARGNMASKLTMNLGLCRIFTSTWTYDGVGAHFECVPK